MKTDQWGKKWLEVKDVHVGMKIKAGAWKGAVITHIAKNGWCTVKNGPLWLTKARVHWLTP